MNPVRVMIETTTTHACACGSKCSSPLTGTPYPAPKAPRSIAPIQGLRRSPPSGWKLSAIYALIAGQDHDLALKLSTYVDRSDEEIGAGLAGSHASYFDNFEDDFALTNIVGMECGGVLDDPKVASPFMDYAFYCIKQRPGRVHPHTDLRGRSLVHALQPSLSSKMEDSLGHFERSAPL